MEIKIRANETGATAWVVDPSDGGETVDGSTRELEPGQELTITAVNAHEASDLEIGDVQIVQPPEGDGEQPGQGEGEAAPA